jgi:hypothetical protein
MRRRGMMMIRGSRFVRNTIGVEAVVLEAVATKVSRKHLRMGEIEEIPRIVAVYEEHPGIVLPFHGTVEIFDGQILLILPVTQHIA